MLPFFSSRKYELLNGTHVSKWKNPGIIVIILFICYFSFYAIESRVTPGTVEMTVYASSEQKRYLSSDLAAPNRLGNHLFEFASLYGLSHTLKRIPAFWIEDETYRNMLKNTREIIPGLVDQFTIFKGKVPPGTNYTKFHVGKCCTFDNPERLERIEDNFLHLTGHFYQSWKYFPNRRNEILGFLRPPKEFRILPKSDQNTHVTCVHARRGDFKGVGFYAADATFIWKATEFIQNQEKHNKHLTLMTVMFGDDPEFMKSVFPETVASDAWRSDVKPTTVHFVSVNSPADDLLYSSQHCDTVLISAPVSTFGWWIGYLSKGNRVFYLDVRTINDGLYKSGQMKTEDFYLPKWTALKLSADNSTVLESDN